MAEPSPLVSPQGASYELREVPAFAPFAWLVRGWDGFRAAPLASGFYGAAFAAIVPKVPDAKPAESARPVVD